MFSLLCELKLLGTVKRVAYSSLTMIHSADDCFSQGSCEEHDKVTQERVFFPQEGIGVMFEGRSSLLEMLYHHQAPGDKNLYVPVKSWPGK